MMKRDIITINEELCNGCGNCVPGCPEGALQIIDGKARLISDLFCDGLGACIGECPTGALTIEKREAEPYDEKRVMKEKIIPAGTNTIKAHLSHLDDHGEDELYRQAIEALKEEGIDTIPIIMAMAEKPSACAGGGCPGSQAKVFTKPEQTLNPEITGSLVSQLEHWPVQLHLVSPQAQYYKERDVVLAADCTAYAVGDFHNRYLKSKSLAIACPKLDEGLDVYIDKLTAMIDFAKINTLTVVIMQVPCCGGLVQMVQRALAQANRKVPVKKIVVGLQGEELSSEWL